MASHSAFKIPITREAYGSFCITIRTGEMLERLAIHFSSKCPFAFYLLTDTEPAGAKHRRSGPSHAGENIRHLRVLDERSHPVGTWHLCNGPTHK
jgi:hypothetical protein